MRIFNATKKCVTGALALALIVSGALALRTFSRVSAFADTGDTLGYVGITEEGVSADIKAVMESFVGSGGVTKVEYVKDYAVQNADGGTSGTVSGIRLNLRGTMASGEYPDSIYPRSSIAIDATKLEYGDKLLGFVIDSNGISASDNNRMRVVAPYISAAAAPLTGNLAYLWISPNGDGAGNPKSQMQIRNYNKEANKYVYEGIYNTDAAKCLKANVTRNNKVSLGGYTNVPFNIYYDYGDNALCADGWDENDSKLVKFLSLPNDKYSTVPVNPAVSSETEYADAATSSAYDFKPNDDGTMYLGFRVDVGAGNQGIILTSFAGLDLTNPAATYPEKQTESVSVKTAGADEASAGKEYAIPEVKFDGNDEKTFNGTVDVFAGSSSAVAPGPVIKAEFIAKHYTKIAEDKAVGDAVTFDKVGSYVLVYKNGDGKQYLLKVNCKLISDVKLIGSGAFKFTNPDTFEEIAADTVIGIESDYKVIVSATTGYLDAVVLKNNDYSPAVETVLTPNNGGVVALDFLALAESGKLGVNNELVATVREYYAVNFVSFGETIKSAAVKQNEAIPFPSDVKTKKGYSFAGWKQLKADGTYEALNGDEILPYASEDTVMTVTVEAQNNLDQYVATLKLPEAYATVATLNATKGTFTVLSDLDFAAPSVASGFKFGGWFYNGKKVTKGEELPSENVDLYAYVCKDVVTVTFVHGSETVDTAEVLKGNKVTASSYSVDGYMLKGWYTDKDGTAEFDFDGAVTADTTLYGVFVKLSDNTVVGGDVTDVKSTARILDDTNVKAFNLISAKGAVTMIISVAGIAAVVAFAVLIILKLTKKKPAAIGDGDESEENESSKGE